MDNNLIYYNKNSISLSSKLIGDAVATSSRYWSDYPKQIQVGSKLIPVKGRGLAIITGINNSDYNCNIKIIQEFDKDGFTPGDLEITSAEDISVIRYLPESLRDYEIIKIIIETITEVFVNVIQNNIKYTNNIIIDDFWKLNAEDLLNYSKNYGFSLNITDNTDNKYSNVLLRSLAISIPELIKKNGTEYIFNIIPLLTKSAINIKRLYTRDYINYSEKIEDLPPGDNEPYLTSKINVHYTTQNGETALTNEQFKYLEKLIYKLAPARVVVYTFIGTDKVISTLNLNVKAFTDDVEDFVNNYNKSEFFMWDGGNANTENFQEEYEGGNVLSSSFNLEVSGNSILPIEKLNNK